MWCVVIKEVRNEGIRHLVSELEDERDLKRRMQAPQNTRLSCNIFHVGIPNLRRERSKRRNGWWKSKVLGHTSKLMRQSKRGGDLWV